MVLTLGKKDSAKAPTCREYGNIEMYVSLIDFVVTFRVLLVMN